MKNTENKEQLLELAIQAALLAGEEMLKIYQSNDFDIKIKEDNSPLTIADQKAHNIINHKLQQTGLPVMSEEGKQIPYSQRKEWDNYWLVDPLDGTKEFIHRNGEFTVNIALISKQQPVMGVILIPVKHALYFACQSKGAYKVEKAGEFKNKNLDCIIKAAKKLPVTKTDASSFHVAVSRSHLSETTEKYIAELREKHPTLELMPLGSSLKLCMIAEGVVDVYPRLSPTNEWDIAAGDAIVRIAGGKVIATDNGKALQYNKEQTLNPSFIATMRSYNISNQ